MKRRHGILLLTVLLSPAAYPADTAGTAAMPLGRVFMSPQQRAELDRLRKIRPADGAAAAIAATSATGDEDSEQAPDASGFIIRAEGEAYLWVDGDFRKVNPDRVRSDRSNDEIMITRHGRPEADDQQKRPVAEHVDDEST